MARMIQAANIFLFLVFFPFAAYAAAETDFTSKTYLKLYQDARDNRYTPVYEYAEFESRNLDNGKLSLYVSGWLGRDFNTAQYEDKTRDELTHAFVRYSPRDDRSLLITAGRQFVFEGVVPEHVDGIAVRWEVTRQTGASLFGGSPVETEFDGRRADSVYGGRIFQRFAGKGELGVSAVSETNAGKRFREEGGLDVWLQPAKKIEFKGQSSYNTLTDSWREHSYNLRISPMDRMTLSALFLESWYDSAFSVRTLSVFSPEFLGAGERLTKKGGIVDYRMTGNLRGTADYALYDYRLAGDAAYYGAGVSAGVRNVQSGVSFHRMEGAVDKLRYRELRVFTLVDGEQWRFSVDALNHAYDSPFNTVKNAYSLNGTAQYKMNDLLTAGFSIEYSKTPDFIQNTTALVNLVYRYEAGR